MTIYGEAGRAASGPINRVVGIAVIENPFTGRFVEDLSPLFDVGAQSGERLMQDVVGLLRGSPVAYHGTLSTPFRPCSIWPTPPGWSG